MLPAGPGGLVVIIRRPGRARDTGSIHNHDTTSRFGEHLGYLSGSLGGLLPQGPRGSECAEFPHPALRTTVSLRAGRAPGPHLCRYRPRSQSGSRGDGPGALRSVRLAVPYPSAEGLPLFAPNGRAAARPRAWGIEFKRCVNRFRKRAPVPLLV